jgi:hypothetical protein
MTIRIAHPKAEDGSVVEEQFLIDQAGGHATIAALSP